MANLASSKKDIRRTVRRTERRRAQISEIETAVRAVRFAPDANTARVAARKAAALLSRAAGKGLMHWRNAARQKSGLAAFISGKFGAGKTS